MSTVITGSNFNPANLSADGLYLETLTPPTYIRGVPTSLAGIVGTASWGWVNKPQLCSSPVSAAKLFGQLGSVALTDPYDLATDLAIAFQQGAKAPLAIWATRVTDGTDTAATATLMSSGTVPFSGLTLSAINTGSLGNAFSVVLAQGSRSNTTSVSLIPFAGLTPELFPNLPNADFWNSLYSALQNGISNVRGPSSLVVPTLTASSSGTTGPALGSFSFAGGTDGRSGVTAQDLVGSAASFPMSGLNAMQSLNPPISVAWVVGSTDSAIYPEIQAFGDAASVWCLGTLPSGLSTQEAVTEAQTQAIEDANFSYAKDFIYWYDPINAVVRFLPPTAAIGGRVAALPPQSNPGNVPVYGVIGTERSSPYTGEQPYHSTEIGLLANAGIMVIANPIPAGKVFGIRSGTTTAIMNPALQAESVVEYARVTNFLGQSLSQVMGIYADKLQGNGPNDPLRQAVRQSLKNFLGSLVGSVIEDYLVTCTYQATGVAGNGINTAQSVAQHFLYAMVQAKYLSSARFFILAIQGGTTVVTSTASAGGSLA